jgi:N-acyl-D-aspartate/D-glutamate deacylase
MPAISLTRREFLFATATLTVGARVLSAQRPAYDLIITGGRVIDPSSRLDAIRDVAIANGRIAAVESSIAAAASKVFDARGKLVVPGLIDIHTHTARSADGRD